MRGNHSHSPGRDIPAIAAAIVIAVVLLVLTAFNARLWLKEVEAFRLRKISFETLTEDVNSNLISDELWLKNEFVTAKGLFDRVTGRRITNDVVKLNNGMLMSVEEEKDMKAQAAELTELSEFLTSQHIPFLYVQAPTKIDLGKTLLPYGVEDYTQENADLLLSLIEENGVDTLDLRPYTCATPEMVDAYFYRTDHHWNPRGAFVGFQLLVDELNTYFGGRLDLTYADSAYWEEQVYDGVFLGSRGRRVGPLYGGVDDLVVITPKFGTDMSFSTEDGDIYRYGDFVKADIREEYLTTEDYFSTDNFEVYTGGQYSLVRMRNHDAPNPQKILLIKDSYSMPVMAFLSAMFAEVDVIDPRDYTDASYAEYAYMTQPDIVVMMLSPGTIPGEEFFRSGSLAAEDKVNAETTVTTLVDRQTFTLPAEEDNPYNSVMLYEELTPDAEYRLHIDAVSFDDGGADFIEAALYSPSERSFVWKEYLDYGYGRENGGFDASFVFPDSQMPDNDVRLIVYAGVNGETEGNGITLRGVTLTETTAASGRAAVCVESNVEIEPEDAAYHSYEVSCDLTPGGVYLLALEDLQLTAGEAEKVTVRMLTSSDETLYAAQFGLSEEPQTHRCSVMVPNLPDGENCRFRIYAGVAGETQNVGIRVGRVSVKRVLGSGGDTVYETGAVALHSQSGNAWNSQTLPVDLRAGVTYTIQAGNIAVNSGSPSSATIALCDKVTTEFFGEASWSTGRAGSWTFTVPDDPEIAARCVLRLYAGAAGDTQGVGVTYENVRVYEDREPTECGLVYASDVTEIDASGNDYRNMVIPAVLRPGEKYSVTIRDMEFMSGSANAITVRLRDQRTETTIEEKLWYVNGERYTFSWECTVPDDAVGATDYILQIFAGTAGETSGVGVRLKDVTITRVYE